MSTNYGWSPGVRFNLVVNHFVFRGLTDRPLTVYGDGSNWRPFIHVRDAARAYAQAALEPELWPQQVYNVGANDANYRISEIAEIVREELDRELDVTYLEDEHPGPSYHVNFDRLAETGFEAEWTLRDGIRDIATELQNGGLTNMTQQTDTDETEPSDQPTIAITGAAGYIGSRVIVELQEAHPDWELTAIDNQYRGQVDSVGDVEIDHVDVRNRDRLENALSGADIVFHLAAVSGVDDCEENADLAYEVNVQERITSRGSAGRLGLHSRFRSVWLCLGTPVVPDYRRPAAGSAELVRAHEGDQRAGHRGFAEGAFPAHLF